MCLKKDEKASVNAYFTNAIFTTQIGSNNYNLSSVCNK